MAERHVWQGACVGEGVWWGACVGRGVMHGGEGACVTGGMCGRGCVQGVCMVGSMHGGACVEEWGVHSRWHAWQGACVAGACVAGVRGITCVACMGGGMCVGA